MGGPTGHGTSPSLRLSRPRCLPGGTRSSRRWAMESNVMGGGG